MDWQWHDDEDARPLPPARRRRLRAWTFFPFALVCVVLGYVADAFGLRSLGPALWCLGATMFLLGLVAVALNHLGADLDDAEAPDQPPLTSWARLPTATRPRWSRRAR